MTATDYRLFARVDPWLAGTPCALGNDTLQSGDLITDVLTEDGQTYVHYSCWRKANR